MATADSVKAKIQNLIALANSTTGGNALTLTDAVNALISGYGGGSGIGRYKHDVRIDFIADLDYSVITEGLITFYNNDPTDYSWDAEGGGNIPTNDVIGCTMIWDGGSYTIQSFDGFTFTMTDGAVLIFESPGEVYDAVTDTQGGGGGDEDMFTFTYYVPDTDYGGEFTCPKSYTWEQFINSDYNVGGLFTDDGGGCVIDSIECYGVYKPNGDQAELYDLVYDTFHGGSSGDTELTVTIDGTSYPITAGMTWGEFIQEHSEFGTDYSGGYGWDLQFDCWDCGGTLCKYVDPVVGGEGGTIFGVDGTVAMPQIVINPYCAYFTAWDKPSNCIFNSIT